MIAKNDRLVIGHEDNLQDLICELSRDMNVYSRLVSGWRDILNITDCSRPFKHNNCSFRSIEHYCLYELLKLKDKEACANFALDSGHELALMEPSEAAASDLLKDFSSDQLVMWDVLRFEVFKNAAIAKFILLEPAKRALMMTYPA